MGKKILLTVDKLCGGLLKLCPPQTGSRKRRDPRVSSQCFMHVYLGHSLTEGTGLCLRGSKGGFAGINPSTGMESYRLLGTLREQDTRDLKR